MKVSHTIMYQCWFILYEESTRNVICIGSSFMHFSDRKSLFYLQNSFSIRKSQRLIVWKMHEIVYTSFQNQSTCTRRQNILHSIFSSSLFILLFINLENVELFWYKQIFYHILRLLSIKYFQLSNHIRS